MVIKSNNNNSFLDDIKETFENLRRIQMKLNPEKYKFTIEEGKFLWNMITSKGIQANPKKVDSLIQPQLPNSIK